MDIEKTIQSLKSKGYQVSYFETSADAVEYLKNSIHGKTIGFWRFENTHRPASAGSAVGVE